MSGVQGTGYDRHAHPRLEPGPGRAFYRNYPLPQHKSAMKAATVAEASGAAGAYWQMHDRLFETQDM
ncbi:MAG: hypothetical protein NTX54_10925 [Chloroflexi bacterium]|nr:hypothetical protein [Chloroflexota bacterium]